MGFTDKFHGVFDFFDSYITFDFGFVLIYLLIS